MRWIAIVLAFAVIACGGGDDDDGDDAGASPTQATAAAGAGSPTQATAAAGAGSPTQATAAATAGSPTKTPVDMSSLPRGNSAEAAGEFAVAVAAQQLAGDWDEVYAELHPGQQAVVTEDQFVACRSALTPPAYEVSLGEVTQATDAASGVPDPTAWDAALTYQLEGYETLAHTLLVYYVDDNMVWAMSQDSLSKFQSGGCDVEPLLASNFALSIANAQIAGDWATVYAGLHPNQQAIVPQELFLECRAADTVEATSAQTVGIFMETDIAPQVPETETYAVTLQLTYADKDPANATIHVYPVNGAFAWTLGVESMAAFAAGQCD